MSEIGLAGLRLVVGLFPSGGSWEESVPLHCSVWLCFLWLLAFSSISKDRNIEMGPSHSCSLSLVLSTLLPPSTFKDPCDYTGLIRIIHNNLPTLK